MDKQLFEENKLLRARIEELEGELFQARSEKSKQAQQSEENLQRAQRKYFSILESIAEAFVSIDREWRYLYVNEYAGKLLGKNKEELLGRVVWELFPDVPEYVSNELHRCMDQDVPVHPEGYNEQTGRWYENHCYPSPEGVWIFFQDITERKHVELTLHESEDRLRLAIESAQLGTWDFDPLTGVLTWSKRCKELFGLPADAPVDYQTFLDRLHPDDRERIHEFVQQALDPDGSGSYDTEYRSRWPDGTERWIMASGRAFFCPVNGERRAVRFIGTVMDITGHKQMEEALRESEERFRLIADMMPSLVWTAQPDGVVDYINRRSREYTGSPPGGDDRRDFSLTQPEIWSVHPEDCQATVNAWHKSLQTSEPYQVEHRLRRFDGAYHWHLSRAIPVRNEHGKLIKWYGEATDIHEIRAARSELEKSVEERTAELVRANKVLRESEMHLQRLSAELLNAQERERKLVAQELHDSLASQLSAIKYGLERKLRSMTGEVVGEPITMEEIIQNVQGAMEETRRIMANLRPSLLDDLGILPTIDWFCREFQKMNPRISIERRTEIEEDQIPDDLKIVIFRLLQESLNNIHKHSQAERVKISLLKENSSILFHVEDYGRGFDLQKTLSQRGMERGIGLSSMRERVELSGGEFELRSAPGRGVSIRAEWQT